MPLTPIDYQKTIIYKIEHNVDKSIVYIGSTIDFKSRKSHHKCNCNNEKSKKYNIKVYVMIRNNGGWDEFQMLEIKKFPCNDKREAEAEEERCRVQLNATMNARKAFGAETIQAYRKENKDKKKEYDKKYREANKDKQKEYMNTYFKNNKDKRKKRDKEYREKKRAILKSNLVPEIPT